jgi:hypothetical protein
MTSPKRIRRGAGIFIVALVTLIASVPASAADGAITLELNKLESRKDACRVYMVFTNGTEQQLDSFKPELVLFAKDGVIAARLVVKGGPLPAGKTKVKLFDIGTTNCAGAGRLLLNGLAACTSAGKAVSGCLGRVKTTSRNAVEFIQ